MYIFMHTYHLIHVYLHVKILYSQRICAMYLVEYDHMQHHILYIILLYTISYILYSLYYIIYTKYCVLYTIEVYGISYLVHSV